MKRIFIVFLLITSKFVLSQNPVIVDNQWYIQKITVNEVDYYPPPGDFQGILIFSAANINLAHPTCSESLYGPIITYSGSDSFDLSDGPLILIDLGCSEAELNYMDLHETFYYIDHIFAKNSFSYTVETNGANFDLTIENGDGDTAYYGNYPAMDIPEFTLPEFKVFPNPTDKLLSIEAQTPITSLAVYELSGKTVLNQNKIEQNTAMIDVSNFSDGIYLMKLEFESHTVFAKFVKN